MVLTSDGTLLVACTGLARFKNPRRLVIAAPSEARFMLLAACATVLSLGVGAALQHLPLSRGAMHLSPSQVSAFLAGSCTRPAPQKKAPHVLVVTGQQTAKSDATHFSPLQNASAFGGLPLKHFTVEHFALSAQHVPASTDLSHFKPLHLASFLSTLSLAHKEASHFAGARQQALASLVLSHLAPAQRASFFTRVVSPQTSAEHFACLSQHVSWSVFVEHLSLLHFNALSALRTNPSPHASLLQVAGTVQQVSASAFSVHLAPAHLPASGFKVDLSGQISLVHWAFLAQHVPFSASVHLVSAQNSASLPAAMTKSPVQTSLHASFLAQQVS
mmetsp:Transcript_13542/g.32753  ORF Transcript_13542/g.32753 Transcript_13542/m.32753 type:complete len:331 (+) Transcript_13542:596-1588(+)